MNSEYQTGQRPDNVVEFTPQHGRLGSRRAQTSTRQVLRKIYGLTEDIEKSEREPRQILDYVEVELEMWAARLEAELLRFTDVEVRR